MNNEVKIIPVVDIGDLDISNKCSDYFSCFFEASNGSYHIFDMTDEEFFEPEYFAELVDAIKSFDIIPQDVLLHFYW